MENSTKKYKLIRDLPHIKAGERCHISSKGNLVTDAGVSLYNRDQLKKFPDILTDWFEEIPGELKTVWDLKYGDQYWFIYLYGMIGEGSWRENRKEDQRARSAGNVLLTREEAEHEVARRKAKVILERDTKGFKPDWSNDGIDEMKYFIV